MILLPKQVLWTGTFTLLLATVISTVFRQPFWLLVPPVMLTLVYLLQNPVNLFYVLLFSIPWSVEYNFPSGFGTDLPDEPLMLLTAFSALAYFLTYRQSLLKRRIHTLIILLALQLTWTVLTVVTSSHFILSAKYLLAKTWYLAAFVAMPVILWREEKVFKRSVLVLLISMLIVTLVTLMRHGVMGFTFNSINDALKPFFRNHVNYSALLVFMAPIQIALWQLTNNKNHRLLVLLSFFITLPALYFSFARGAWLALLTGGITYWILQKKWLVQSYLITIVLCIAMVFWLKADNRYLRFAHDFQSTIFHQNFNEHLAATYQLKDVSTAERFHRWIAGVRMIEDCCPTGFGPTTFYQHYKGYTVPAFKTWVSRNEEQSTVHNYFLLLVIEQGVLGLLLFLLLLGTCFWYAQKIYCHTTDIFWKRIVATVAVILVMQCTVNFLSDLIETDKVGTVFYMCIAALIIADRKTKHTNENTKA